MSRDPGADASEHRRGFVEIIEDFLKRLDGGRLYDRDLPTLAPAVRDLAEALTRRENNTWRLRWER